MNRFKEKSKNKFKKISAKTSFYIWGKNSMEAAILNKKREIKIIYTLNQNLFWLDGKFKLVDRKKPQIKILDKYALNKLSGNLPHQGIIADVKSLEWPSLDDVLISLQNKTSRIVILDQVSDPQNIGSIIRISQAFKVDAIVTTKKHVPNENGLMVKASAGAIENLPLIRVTNLVRAIDTLKNKNFEVIGLEKKGSHKLEEISHFPRIALVLGSEGSGMRRLTKEKLSYLVKIPIAEKTESLNVSSAAAIALYVIQQ